MKLVWSKEALQALESVIEYIAHDNPTAAQSLFEIIITAVTTILPINPQAGRPGRVDETRELVVHASYIVVYRYFEQTLEILTIRHTAHLWPDTFD